MEWLTAFAAEIFTTQFLFALASIVVIDIVLAGDNAIVIALAARNLPPALQKKAIIWGTVGAIVVRTLMTLAVVWLLKVPGLMLVGGLALLWIAYRLLTSDEDEHGNGSANTSFVAAIKTIVIADAVMGVDNVLAVAGAAHGSFLLVVLGLLISVPIMVWGSRLILRLMERYPAIIYIGAGVLVVTAVKMVTGEPLVKPWFQAHAWVAWMLYAAALFGVLGGSRMVVGSRAKARELESSAA
ncbi:Integral membrane protein TerC family protein [Pigmentiphaga humi]|uniref:Integral membrane protein TerC family protein n=1 Tax=Pigmentiphaga humi TaxID=2478468 RepID=A0A3P4B3X7_9BURK|nr:TerC family protein [Pigmentiphaga humi]VCU70742.1 Integral membrane protein TerC family protein [Pigmentiphaga humi]